MHYHMCLPNVGSVPLTTWTRWEPQERLMLGPVWSPVPRFQAVLIVCRTNEWKVEEGKGMEKVI